MEIPSVGEPLPFEMVTVSGSRATVREGGSPSRSMPSPLLSACCCTSARVREASDSGLSFDRFRGPI
jgi:hypothetical protein